jgi:hypothetical protein
MIPTCPRKGAAIMSRNRSLWAAGLLAVLGALQGTAAVADLEAPEEVLKSRGLTKSGSAYVVALEADFREKYAKVEPLYRQLRELYTKLFAIAKYQYEYDDMDQQYDMVTEQLRNVQAEQDAFPSTSNSVLKQQWAELLELERQLRLQRNALNRELNLRYKNLVSDRQKEKLSDEFQKQRENFLKEAQAPRALAEEIKKRYGELSKDPAVKKALDELRRSTKSSISLGPSAEFRKKSTQLKNAEAELSPRNFVRKSTGKKAQKSQAERKTKNATKGKSSVSPDSSKTEDGPN